MLPRFSVLIVWVLIALTMLMGCAPSPTPTPTSTPLPPTSTPIPPTPTPVPPTATPVPPTATPKPKISVPVVMNLVPNIAVMMLANAGLKVEQIEEPTSSCNPFVRKQDPFAGTEVEVGSVVKIYYCVGPTPTIPPTVTAVPPTATRLPDPCNLQPGQSGAYLVNNYDFKILVTIGGGEWGTHDYWAEPKSILVMPFPPGRYTTTITVPGKGTYKFAADRVEFVAGRCVRITGPWDNP